MNMMKFVNLTHHTASRVIVFLWVPTIFIQNYVYVAYVVKEVESFWRRGLVN